MSGQITVVTGGGRGIGAATCERLARDGHDIVFSYRADTEAAEQVAERVRAAGARCVTFQGDTSSEEDVDALFDSARPLGPVTGLVNNAGITGPVGRLVDVDAAGMRRALDVNVLGVLLCARRAARDMAGRGGAIVNVSSGAATTGGANEYVHYAASKAAVDTITIGLSKELGPDGIRVNTVSPGVVWTGIHADPQRPARLAEQVPLGRAGDPPEIAAAIAWLLSPDASYTNGANIRVAGGR